LIQSQTAKTPRLIIPGLSVRFFRLIHAARRRGLALRKVTKPAPATTFAYFLRFVHGGVVDAPQRIRAAPRQRFPFSDDERNARGSCSLGNRPQKSPALWVRIVPDPAREQLAHDTLCHLATLRHPFEHMRMAALNRVRGSAAHGYVTRTPRFGPPYSWCPPISGQAPGDAGHARQPVTASSLSKPPSRFPPFVVPSPIHSKTAG
jgi:hypothetical protein